MLLLKNRALKTAPRIVSAAPVSQGRWAHLCSISTYLPSNVNHWQFTRNQMLDNQFELVQYAFRCSRSGALRERSRFDPFLEEVHGYVHLLRRHSFLRYIADLREYNVRRMVVIDGIAAALGQLAHVGLPVIYDAIPVESLREVSVVSIQRLVSQTIRNMKRSLHSFESDSSIAKGYSQAIQRWETALQALRTSPPASAKN
jgi:hypothetical protein